jgi:hypothetical protein
MFSEMECRHASVPEMTVNKVMNSKKLNDLYSETTKCRVYVPFVLLFSPFAAFTVALSLLT